MFQHRNHMSVPHSPQSIGQREQAARITKLRDALHVLWVEKCTWGKRPDFYKEAAPAYTQIGKAGGHVLLGLLDDIEIALTFNRKEMDKASKATCYQAYERVLKAVLSAETIERHQIQQAAWRAKRDLRYA